VIGTREIQPPHAKVPKLRMDCTIRIGRPIKVERYQDRADDRMVLRQITDEVMYEIRELTGQDYRDVYATKKAEGIPTDMARVAHVDDAAPTGNRAGVRRRGESGLAARGPVDSPGP
jgi:1-acyl-sn-glycerol-3-phosphate acyltransferase